MADQWGHPVRPASASSWRHADALKRNDLINTENPENKQNFEIKYLLIYKSKWKDLYMKNDQ